MTLLEKIAPYFPYNLTAKHPNYECIYNCTMLSIEKNDIYCESSDPEFMYGHWMFANYIKPILRPLSDLTKEIEHNGEKVIPFDIVCPPEYYNNETQKREVHKIMLQSWGKMGDFSSCYFGTTMLLISMHFDVFGIIESGEAIDINTLKE